MRQLVFALLWMAGLTVQAQKFEDYFEDRTLRLDYCFAGSDVQTDIYVDELVSLPHWYGKRQHLDEVPLTGNGQIIMRRHNSEEVIYRHSFSTLFQE